MMKKYINGSVTVEASLALAFFIFGYLAVLSLVFTVRAESAVQYGIDRTAAEIAHYCYAADRLSVTDYIRKAGVTAGEAADSMALLSSDEKLPAGGSEESGRIAELADMLTGGRKISGMAGAPLIKAVFSSCMAGDRESTDDFLMDMAGITCDDIDFSYSSVLSDSDDVEIVAVYTIKLRTFGLFGDAGISFTMKNTAAACAWVPEKNKRGRKSDSLWDLPNLERGKAWTSLIKSENPSDAVKGGHGIDLYRLGKYSAVRSADIFSPKYSSCRDRKSSNPDDYTVKTEAVYTLLSEFALATRRAVKDYSGKLQFENGIHVPDPGAAGKTELIIIVPEEAGNTFKIKNALEECGNTVSAEYGVSVKFVYRQKTLS